MEKLHNNHNVYILGAGFSAERGLPVVKNFMFEMRDAYDWLLSAGRVHEYQAIERVLEFRHDAAASAYRVKIDLENIEELFSLASASTGFKRSRDLSKSIRVAIAATLDYCRTKIAERKVFVYGPCAIPFYKPYLKASEILGQHEYRDIPAYQHYLRSMLCSTDGSTVENTILSFNYDTLVEEALSNMNVGFSYGFKTNTVSYRANLRKFAKPDVKLLKLHGSVNWAHLEQAGTGVSQLTVFDTYDAVREARAVPDLIPPTWRKVFDGNLENVWDDAIEAIKSATRIFVIGFSVPETDTHFKYLLAAGLQSNISLRDIVFVNPDSGLETFRSRINGLFTTPQGSRVSFSSETASSYLLNLAHKNNSNRGFPRFGVEVK